MDHLFRREAISDNRIAVDAMRGLAAILVLLCHADQYNMIPLIWPKVWNDNAGGIGVSLFFIVSGYLVWESAGRTLHKGLHVYFINRLTRIAPLYYVSLAAVVLAAPLFIDYFKPVISGDTIFRHLTFTQTINPPVHRDLNPVLWTLTLEMLFYAMVPMMWAARKHIWIWLPISIVLAFDAVRVHFGFMVSFLAYFPLFAVGLTLAQYRLSPTIWTTLLVLALTSASFFIGSVAPYFYLPLIAVSIFSLISVMGRFPNITGKIFMPFAAAGVISYSLYIWHYVLIQLVGPRMNAIPWIAQNQALQTSIFAVAVFGLSALSYVLIEKPGMTTLRKAILKVWPNPAASKIEAAQT